MQGLDQFHALDQWVFTRLAAFRTTGLSMVLFDRQRDIHSVTYGLAAPDTGSTVTLDTLFAIGSIGKAFTAVAALQAHESGTLELHAPVVEYLPWFRVGSNFDAITSHHLLTHTAGLVEGMDMIPDAHGEVWSLRFTETGSPPGEHFYYSNVGYKVLGLVLERATGTSYSDLIRTGILEPLGMDDSYPSITHEIRPRMARGYRSIYDDRPHHPSYPLIPDDWVETDTADGSVAASARDLARFGRMLLNRGEGPAGAILSAASFDLLISKFIPQDDTFYYGYGLEVYDDSGSTCIGHGGDMPGYRAHIHMDIDNGLGVALLESTPHAPMVSHFAFDFLRAQRSSQPPLDVPAVPDPTLLSHGRAEDYVGEYFLAGSGKNSSEKLSISTDGEHLFVDFHGERVTLEECEPDCFYALSRDLSNFLLRFGRSAGGRIVEITHGPEWYINDHYRGPQQFELPPGWSAYPGHYRAHNPWYSNFRIIVRKDVLILVEPSGRELPLAHIREGFFRLGDSHSPERLQFDQVTDGQALRVIRSGCPYYRFFTP